MKFEDIDLFRPGIVLAILAFADKEESLLWLMAKLLLVFYLLNFLYMLIPKIRKELLNKDEKKITIDPDLDNTSDIMAITPSYPKRKYDDPLKMLDEISK